MKRFYFFTLVAAMFAACTSNMTDEQAVCIDIATPETLIGTFEGDEMRIQLDNGKTVWTADDLVSVFYLSNANQKWQYQGETGERTGNLKQVEAGNATETMKRVVVVYPYNENYYINTDTYNVKGWLPAEQTYLADSYGLNGNIMISQSEYNQFSLKNVCGWLKLQLTSNGEKVQSISLKGNNGEQVAGEIYINSSDATAALAADMGSADENDNSAGGNLVFEDTILTEVTLNCGDGVTLSAEPTAFYIALPPQEFSKGLTVEIACTDGSKMTKSTEKTITIERNTIQPMVTLTYDGVVPEEYELAYTTNDGEPLDPLTTEGFGAKFVENIFDPATCKGALKFDGRVTTIPARAFVACTNLTQIELTKDITAINAEAFSGCKALAVMDIPQSVKKIDDKAFYKCGGMTEITIPSSVTSIGTSSFEGCGGKANINCRIYSNYPETDGKFYKAKFTEVVIGNSITSIGLCAFYKCASLASITIPDSVTSIGRSAFEDCTSLISVTIPDSVTSIGNYAFYNCNSLTSITIPDSVTSIGEYTFRDCTSLKEVFYTGDLSAWCKIDFKYYYSNPMCNRAKLYLNGVELTEATIPSVMTEIKYTFRGCTSLTSVTIPDSVTKIGHEAFRYCTSLTSVTIPDSVTSIGDFAFSGCTSLKEVYYNGDLSAWCKIDFSDFYSNPMNKGAKLYLNGIELTGDVTIPSDVTEIKDCVFSCCTSLTSITMGDSVTSIGNYAFYNCTSLTSITIPDSVTEIRGATFYCCTSLTSVTIGDRVTKIETHAFYGCTSLTSVTIPNSVSYIGSYAFDGCTSLKEVYCKPTTPPSGGSYMFDNNASGRKIYVPRASVDAYKAASYWSSYADDIEPYDF